MVGPLRDPARSAAAVARSLQIDGRTAQIARSLEQGGISSIVLKGPTIALWLYRDRVERPYEDSDILVPPHRFAEAEAVLQQLGYVQLAATLPFDRPSYAHSWRLGWHYVDLHRSLIGVGVTEEQAWECLSTRTETMAIGGLELQVMDTPARLMHIALHAWQHGIQKEKPVKDLRLGIEKLEIEQWADAAAIAEDLRALPAFVAGLDLCPQGSDLIEGLKLVRKSTTETALRARGTPPLALGFDWLAQQRGLRAKLKFLRWKAFPPAPYIRKWRPLGNKGIVGLLSTYVWHLAWLLRHGPRGAREWLKARTRASRP